MEYDIEFIELENAMFGKAEQQFGDITIPAEHPDWIEIETRALNLFSRTKDLRIILMLTQSWLEMRGVCGYADGIYLLKRALELYWEDVWPRMEFEGEYDPLFRLNILASIEDNSPLTIQVMNSILLRCNSKELTLQEVCSLLDNTVTEISGYTGGRIRLLDDLKKHANAPEIGALKRLHTLFIDILEIIRQEMSESHVPELTHLLKNLNNVIQFSPSSQPAINIPGKPAESESANPVLAKERMLHEGMPQERAQGESPSAIHSTNSTSIDWQAFEAINRDEARMLLEKAKNYFVMHEPSHPAPMMITRIQRLIDRDFIDIVYDLAPDGLNQLEIIFGRPDNLDTE
ncbi:ImpA family type VI secretion system protein [Xenorhabdus santafensis]|uniref:type VI secretion system protein TssA n=1 Tax=Xenorhabdus santafensis TaxID=2582833 RepID=UPI003F6B601D